MGDQQKRISIAAISKLILTGYVLALVTGTHIPLIDPLLKVEVDNFDKVLHFSAYAVFAFLLATTWQLSSGILNTRHLVWAWLALVAFGALDELTQPLVNRDCSVWDLTADALGAAVGLAAFVWVRKRLPPTAGDA